MKPVRTKQKPTTQPRVVSPRMRRQSRRRAIVNDWPRVSVVKRMRTSAVAY